MQRKTKSNAHSGRYRKRAISLFLVLTLILGLFQSPFMAPNVVYADTIGNRSELYAAGKGVYGEHGLGAMGESLTPRLITQANLKDKEIKSIAGGRNHSLVLTKTGEVYAMGDNQYGQLGLGDKTTRNVPTKIIIAGSPKIIEIATKGDHSLILTEDGDVYVFGYNNKGQLGNGNNTDQASPVKLTGLPKVKGIAGGEYHSLLWAQNGEVYTMGVNNLGQLGVGDTNDRNRPTKTSLTNVKAIALGYHHALILKENGEVFSFGAPGDGRLGYTISGWAQSTPQKIDGISAKAVAAGENFSLILTGDGDIYSFGFNQYGQLGVGDTNERTSPTKVLGFSGVTDIFASLYSSYAITKDGKVYGFGKNNMGQLGIGHKELAIKRPTHITTLKNIRVISGGANYALFLGDYKVMEKINDQIFTSLLVGYTADSQETKTITINRTGDEDLANLTVSLSGADASAFVITQPISTSLDATNSSTTFTIKAKNKLAPWTYTAAVTVNADVAGTQDTIEPISFNIKQAVAYPISTIAGRESSGWIGDNGAATSAYLNNPVFAAVDSGGNIYIADRNNYKIRKVDASTGIISAFAGTGSSGNTGDGGLATSAKLNEAYSVAIDSSGNAYIADKNNHKIRKVDATTKNISTVAGTGAAGYDSSSEGKAATSAKLNQPFDVAVDKDGNIYIADAANQRIRKVDASGNITTIAGSGTKGYNNDSINATTAHLNNPYGIAVDKDGNVYIADTDNHRIRKIDAAGNIATVAGTGVAGYSGDGEIAISAKLNRPHRVAVDSKGNLYIADYVNHRIRKVDAKTQIITTIAGTGISGFSGDGGSALEAKLNNPLSVAVDQYDNVYIADVANHRVRKLASGRPSNVTYEIEGLPDQIMPLLTKGYTAGSQVAKSITLTKAGAGELEDLTVSLSGDNASSFEITQPESNVLDDTIHSTTFTIKAKDGLALGIYTAEVKVSAKYMTDVSFKVTQVVDRGSQKVEADIIYTLAGIGTAGYSGDGDAAVLAKMNAPVGVALDKDGNIYIADMGAHVVRKIEIITGKISTVAGNGTEGFSGDGGKATEAQLKTPIDVAVDADGNLYILDYGNCIIRKVDKISGNIKTIAGTGPEFNSSGDGGPATSAVLGYPYTVELDSSGNVYIAEMLGRVVRKIDKNTGIITIVAGSRKTTDGTGDGGPATSTILGMLTGLAFDSVGNMYIAEASSHSIRKVDKQTSIITTVAGNGTEGYSGDGGLATAAQLNMPMGLAFDSSDNLYIVDKDNHCIRKVDKQTGIISTVAGTGEAGFSGDGGQATLAKLNEPMGIGIDENNNIYIGDTMNSAVRIIGGTNSNAPNTHTVTFDTQGGSAIASIENVASESTITDPDNPRKEGYTFVGWFKEKDGNVMWNFAVDKITSDITLYARWEAQDPTISPATATFDKAAGKQQDISATITFNGDKLTGIYKWSPSFLMFKEGTHYSMVRDENGKYSTITFKKEYLATLEKGTELIEFLFHSDKSLYLNITVTDTTPSIQTYTVKFNSQGGSATADRGNIVSGSSITAPTSPTRAGYTFAGWYKEAAYTNAWNFATDTVTANTTLYAKWTAIEYHVNYNGNDNTSGSVPADNHGYEYFEEVTVKGNDGNLAKDGYIFIGWNTKADGTGSEYGEGASFNMPLADVTLYAQWKAVEYTINYNGNGNTSGSEPTDDTSYTYEDSVTLAGNTGSLARIGYSFAGWNTEADGNGDSYAAESSFNMPAKNLTLYAKWTPVEYSVTYDGNGNTSGNVPVDSNSYNYQQTVVAAVYEEGLSKLGFNFVGWNTAADGNGMDYAAGSSFNMPADNLTLYAKWIDERYNVIYVGNGNDSGTAPVDENTYASDEDVTVSSNTGSLVRVGYTFAGWNTEADGNGDSYAAGSSFNMPAGNVMLYAQWTPATYSVTYDGNGNTSGNVPVDSAAYSYLTSVTVKNNINLTKNGYMFTGWNTKADGSGSSYDGNTKFNMPADNVTLYAKWTPTKYIIVYSGNGNTSGAAPAVSDKHEYNSMITISANTGSLEKTGYTFAGWSTMPNGIGDSYEENQSLPMPGKDMMLFAKWNVNQYTISLVSNEGSTVTNITQNYKTRVTAPDNPTREGYTFAGWYSDEALTMAYTFATMPAENITLYAKWAENAPKAYIVSFDSQGGSAVENITNVVEGNKITASTAPTMAGHTFAGWYKEAACTNEWNFAVDTVTENVTLYAKWTPTKYIILYDGNGNTSGSAPVDNNKYDYESPATISANTGSLEKTGYTFAGWNTRPNKTGTDYSESQQITMPSSDMMLFAKWDINQYTISFDSKFGSFVAPITIGYGKTVAAPAAPTRAGYTFVGWYSDEALTTAYIFSTMPAEHITLYAKWTQDAPNTYKVSFDSQGGSAVTSKNDVVSGSKITAPAAPTKAGYTFGGWYKEAACTNAWNFNTDTVTANITLYAKWTIDSSGGGSNGGGNGGGSKPSTPTPEPVKPAETGINVLVNGKVENAGTATTTKQGDKTVTIIAVDEAKLEKKLASEGNNSTVTIPVNTQADVVIGELNGQMIKSMEDKAAVLIVKTEAAAYTLPAQQINIADMSAQLGKNVSLKDIKVQIEIANSSTDTVRIAESSAQKGEFTIVAPPMDFTVRCTLSGKTIEVSSFNTYVERTIAIPDGIDPNKITTGIVIEADGAVRHVPTRVVQIDGKYYARINSLTNSTYSVVWHPLEFKDVEKHWAKGAVNDMGSRMIISGIGSGRFEPDREITRAEFAAIIVRALGLKPGVGKNTFEDVQASAWYSDYIKTAVEYKIVSGYGNGKIGPNDSITREQAMTMIARAMRLTGLEAELSSGDMDTLLWGFEDWAEVAIWSREGMASCIKNGIVSGKGGKLLAPKDEITRAEVAAIVQRLLQKSGLI